MAHFNQTMRALGQDRNAIVGVATLTVAGLILVWAMWLIFSTVTIYEVSRQARVEVGRTPQNIDAATPSKILSTAMEVGSTVKAGDVLMVLDSAPEQLKLRQARYHIAALDQRLVAIDDEIAARKLARSQAEGAANAALQAAGHHIEEARLKASFARDSVNRLKQLLERGSISKVETERADNEAGRLEAERDALIADLAQMQQAGQSTDNSSKADIQNLINSRAMLAGDRDETSATADKLVTDIAARTIVAPIDGTLADVTPLKAGSFVAEGQRLATIVPDGDMLIVAAFSPTATLGRIRPGQSAWLRLDSYPWAEYGTIEARVTGLASEVRDGLVQVQFTIQSVPSTGIVLSHGLPGQVEVAVDESSPAVLALRSAGFYWSGQQQGQPAVASAEVAP